MTKLIIESCRCLAVLTVITGLAYPLLVTAIAQGLFPAAANGGLIRQNDRVVGARLIGQPFEGTKYFWGRPSATSPFAYNSASSSGSNLGPSNPDFRKAIEGRVAALNAANPHGGAIPLDLVTASASGLDPHISPGAALYQAPRVAAARSVPVDHLRQLITRLTDAPQFGILGNAGVNVLLLNQALDRHE